jgi:beta-lactamase superfamily II metal-dependent hydrolase
MPFLQRDLDLLIVTRPATAAIAALPPVLDRYSVHNVLVNGSLGAGEAARALSVALETLGVQQIPVTAGYQLQSSDGVSIEVLSPENVADEASTDRPSALVLRLRYGEGTLLIAPELSAESADDMAARGLFLGASALLTSGRSLETLAPEQVAAVSPQAILLTVEQGSSEAVGLDRTTAALFRAPVFRTDRQGTIELVSDGRLLTLYSER